MFLTKEQLSAKITVFFETKKLNLIEVCILIIANIKCLEVLFILH